MRPHHPVLKLCGVCVYACARVAFALAASRWWTPVSIQLSNSFLEREHIRSHCHHYASLGSVQLWLAGGFSPGAPLPSFTSCPEFKLQNELATKRKFSALDSAKGGGGGGGGLLAYGADAVKRPKGDDDGGAAAAAPSRSINLTDPIRDFTLMWKVPSSTA